MKKFKRVLGIDDGPFNRDDESQTVLVGVLARFDGYVEGVVVRKVVVDGADSTEKIISMFETHFSDQIDYVMTNGITFAGFNVCDIFQINEKTGIPVVSITRRDPDIGEMKAAIRKHFSKDMELRIRKLERTEIREVVLNNGHSVFVNSCGISAEDTRELIQKTIIRGNIPEPVRLAHLIAGAIKKGESRGKS